MVRLLPVPLQRYLRIVAVAVVVAGGALAAVGFLFTALFEIQGFGGPRDQGPRAGYLVELSVAFVASVLIPVLVWRRLLDNGPGWIVASAVSVAGVVVILGISFAS
jgi:hypothetical protein